MPVSVAIQRQQLRDGLLVALCWLSVYVLIVGGEMQAEEKALWYREVACGRQLGAGIFSCR